MRCLPVILVAVAAAGASCARPADDENALKLTTQSAEQAFTNVNESQVEPPYDIKAFRRAIQSMPLLRVANIGPAQAALLADTADAFVVGELLSIRDGGLVAYGQTTVVCEASEGRSLGTSCDRPAAQATVEVLLAVEDVRHLGGQPTGIAVGSTTRIRLVVGDGITPPGAAASQEVIAQLISSAPVGSRVAAFLLTDERGELRLAHPDAWAMVTGDQLVALAVHPDRDDRGLGGTHSLDAMLSELSS